MKPDRIAELRAWVAYGKTHDEVRAELASISKTQEYHRERAKNWADLSTALKDHEAALPLLVLVKSESASQIRLDMQTTEEAWAEGESAGTSILRAALAYKERSGG